MLPSELLVSRVWGRRITPIFSPLSEEQVAIADEIIKTFKEYVGRKQGELSSVLDEFEEDLNYRFIRGLRVLLERRCRFESISPLEPAEARRVVFEEANSLGVITNEEKRERVIKKSATILGVSVEDLEKSLWADYEHELVLKEFEEVEPIELLKLYNLSLAQTLLFSATNMEILVRSGYQELFRTIKFYGLMYQAEVHNGNFVINIDGPVSLLKLTERYGTSMAKILPLIVSLEGWQIKASILRRGLEKKPRFYDFIMDKREADKLRTPYTRERERFDSQVEEDFFHRFNALKTGWTLSREPEPLISGSTVMIPDFGFEKEGMKILMEIIGFWTEEYLERKMAKLEKIEQKLILAVDQNLACSTFENIPGNIIYYKKKVPLKPIVEILKKLEQNKIRQEKAKLQIATFQLDKDIVPLKELASKHKVSVKAIKESINVKGYKLVGNTMISERMLIKLGQELENLNIKTRTEAATLFQRKGILEVDQLLEVLGYKVIWSALDPEKVTITKKED
ncbi:MAG: DUF790 family protein [Candidatus Jordarchaeum sp.]|uniref:DUF790 family protein n=1 Tax=Candidatus Jordarchaeum sp. TaxID=2823881 RepID=UPI00404B6023